MDFASNETNNRLFQLDLGLRSIPSIPFPWQLHEMLDTCEKKGLDHIISWLPNNASFRVHNHPVFMNSIIGTFFKQTKYKSFQRQLNIWGFHRITTGPNKGGYCHRHFIRSKEELCCMMSRQKIKSGKPAKPRAYFPLKAYVSTSGENRGVDSILNCNSLEDHALNTMLTKDRDFTVPMLPRLSRLVSNDIPSDNAQKGMLPFDCADVSSYPSLDCRDQVPASTSFAENNRMASPRGVDSLAMRTILPLAFSERCCMAPNLGTTNINVNDENLQDLGTMMPFLSPDPIAPNHPLSKPQPNNGTSTTNFNLAISNMIDLLVNNNTPTRQEVHQEEDDSVFGGKVFFALGDRPERRSSLGGC